MDEPVFERVLVAVGPGRQSALVLATAARIAARLGSELIGLFVEDESWIRLAELPGASVITTASGRRALDTTTLERALRRARAEAESVLERAAARLGIHTTFRVLRGMTGKAIAASVQKGDLLVLEHSELVHALRAAVAGSDASILSLDPADADVRSIAVVYDPSDAGRTRLAAAARLASAAECELTVLVPAGAEERAASERAATQPEAAPGAGRTLEARIAEALAQGGMRSGPRPRLLRISGSARPAELAAREPRAILALSSTDFIAVQSGGEQTAIVRLLRRSLLVLR